MSYCRWSNDSDVYCYFAGVYVTHVAHVQPEHGLGDGYFTDPSLELFRDRLLWLRGLGYRVPTRTFERIERELEQ